MNEWFLLAIGVVLTVGTGFFVAAEFSLVNLDRAQLENDRDRGVSGLTSTISALKHTSTHLSSAQLGITITTLLAGYTLEPAFSRFLSPLFHLMNIGEPWSTTLAGVLSIAIATVLSMLFGELVPKNFALALPEATAKVVVPFQVAFTTVFRPIVSVLNNSSNAVLRRVGIEPKEELSSARTAEELSSLVHTSALFGSLDAQTATLLERTLDFSEHTASDVMTPRPRLTVIERDKSAADVVELARATGHSRFPIIDDGLDDVIGLVHVKQAVAIPRERRADVPVTALRTDPLRVPETMTLDTLLGLLRGRSYQMAIVVDEYGGTAGAATLEDLVEELVGAVSDEHDRIGAEVITFHTGERSISGLLRPDEVDEQIGLSVPDDGPYETVGGYLMARLGRIPVVGDEVVVDQAVLRVERMDGRRIDRIRVTALVDDTSDMSGPDASGPDASVPEAADGFASRDAKADAAGAMQGTEADTATAASTGTEAADDSQAEAARVVDRQILDQLAPIDVIVPITPTARVYPVADSDAADAEAPLDDIGRLTGWYVDLTETDSAQSAEQESASSSDDEPKRGDADV